MKAKRKYAVGSTVRIIGYEAPGTIDAFDPGDCKYLVEVGAESRWCDEGDILKVIAVPGIPVVDRNGKLRTFDDIQGDLLRFALPHFDFDTIEVSRQLSIGRTTLYRLMQRHEIKPERRR